MLTFKNDRVMKTRLMLIGLILFVSFLGYGQENISQSAQHQEDGFPFKGGKEACRQFFNENLNLDMVANPGLPKGKLSMICLIDTLGKANVVVEPAQYYYSKNKVKLVSYDKKNIGKEFVRVAKLVEWEKPANLKDKKITRCMITVSIPYSKEEPEGMMFFVW